MLRRAWLIFGILLTCLLCAGIGAAGTLWFFHKALYEEEGRRLYMDNALACRTYWDVRSGAADARHEFAGGERGLLQVVTGSRVSIDYYVPALRHGAKAELRRRFPLPGPRAIGEQAYQRHYMWKPQCIPDRYAWDYNDTMLRLLGREGDAVSHVASPELIGEER